MSATGVAPEHAALWSRVVHACVRESPLLRVVVTNCILVSLENDHAVLCCNDRFAQSAPKHLPKITDIFTRERGVATRVSFQETTPPANAAESAAASAESGEARSETDAAETPEVVVRPAFNPNAATEHPLVKQAIELFGARVVDVQPRRN